MESRASSGCIVLRSLPEFRKSAVSYGKVAQNAGTFGTDGESRQRVKPEGAPMDHPKKAALREHLKHSALN